MEDILWNCRDILRSKASLATRRDIILTLVFLKFVGEKRNQQREVIAQEIRARNEKNKGVDGKRPIPEDAFLPFSTPEQQDGGIEPPPVLASRFFRFLNLL